MRPPWRCSRRRPGCRTTASPDRQTHQRTPRGMRPAVSHSAVHAGGVSGTETRNPSTASAPAPVISKGIKVSRPMRLTRTIKLFPLAEPGPPFVPARGNIHTWDDQGRALGHVDNDTHTFCDPGTAKERSEQDGHLPLSGESKALNQCGHSQFVCLWRDDGPLWAIAWQSMPREDHAACASVTSCLTPLTDPNGGAHSLTHAVAVGQSGPATAPRP